MLRIITVVTAVIFSLSCGIAYSSAIMTPLTSVYQSELKRAIYWRGFEDADAHADHLKKIIVEGADVNEKSHSGETPLYIAAWTGNLVAAEILIEAGADVNIRDIDGDTPLMAAADQGNALMTQKLISLGADVTVRNSDGATPLHYAAGADYGGAEVASILIDAGVDVNAINSVGRSALNYAVLNNEKETSKVIRNHGGRDVSLQGNNDCKATNFFKEMAIFLRQIWNTKRDCTPSKG